MPFLKYILEELPCPRCNATAQKRVEDRKDQLIIVIICKYCKFRKSLGVTTRKYLDLEIQEQKLQNLLELSNSDKEHAKISARLKNIAIRKKRALLQL